MYSPYYLFFDGLNNGEYNAIHIDFDSFEEFPWLFGKPEFYGNSILATWTEIPAWRPDSSSEINNFELLEWENDHFRPLYKGGMIEYRTNPGYTWEYYIGDIDGDGFEDIIFSCGWPANQFVHWERKPFLLGLKEFSTNTDSIYSDTSAYVEVTIKLKSPRPDIDLTVYKQIKYDAKRIFIFYKLNPEPLANDTLFTLRDEVVIPGIPCYYFLAADDHDGCPSMYGPVFGVPPEDLQEILSAFIVFRLGNSDTLGISWTSRFKDSQWELYRSTDSEHGYEKIGAEVYTGDRGHFVRDGGLARGIEYYYKLHLLWPENEVSWYGPAHNSVPEVNYPTMISIDPPSPNPFEDHTRLGIKMLRDSENGKLTNVTLTIYNIAGQKVKTIRLDNIPVGSSELIWDGTDSHGEFTSSGIYFYRISISGREVKMGKMLYLK
ncbi:MAG: hypothetical protein CO189_06890 [candidate division Zixibacteria bacterium CG_4_9_14_3_um_filter_46_8]|nr:MAG: hypothetical protein CO189_06890 [candidate division Zixibacteria bacterium CG_4_9_14_3_um_filter_46_8]